MTTAEIVTAVVYQVNKINTSVENRRRLCGLQVKKNLEMTLNQEGYAYNLKRQFALTEFYVIDSVSFLKIYYYNI